MCGSAVPRVPIYSAGLRCSKVKNCAIIKTPSAPNRSKIAQPHSLPRPTLPLHSWFVCEVRSAKKYEPILRLFVPHRASMVRNNRRIWLYMIGLPANTLWLCLVNTVQLRECHLKSPHISIAWQSALTLVFLEYSD